MRRLPDSRRGQAFAELALVLFLFFCVITAVLQLVWIGSAQIRCQFAARRAAWLCASCNHLNFDSAQAELQSIFPGCEAVKTGGDREEGASVKVTYTVPAVGFFHLARPQGFNLSARAAVIAYNPKPAANDLMEKGTQAVMDELHRNGVQ